MGLKTAIIIAGGKGTRLEEKSIDLPKPLIPVGGLPILERILLWLKNNGVEKIIIGVAYKKELIKNYFGDGSKFGLEIIYTEHDENGGTEDAFKAAIDQSGIEDENFYAMNGDQVTDLQLIGLTNAHLKNNAVATLVTIKLKTNFGIIETDVKNKITSIQEKWIVPNTLMNAGIYVFNKKIKDYLVGKNIEENAFCKLCEEGKLYSFYYDGEWFSVNNKKDLKEAEDYLKKVDSIINI